MKKRKCSQIVNKLQENNLRVTKQRKAIYKVLKKKSKPLSAREIYNILKIEHSDLRLSTIYRNLKLFVEKNIVKKLSYGQKENYYELQEGEHHHHLICTECGEVRPLQCPLQGFETQVEQENNYHVLEHEIKVYGLCSACR